MHVLLQCCKHRVWYTSRSVWFSNCELIICCLTNGRLHCNQIHRQLFGWTTKRQKNCPQAPSKPRQILWIEVLTKQVFFRWISISIHWQLFAIQRDLLDTFLPQDGPGGIEVVDMLIQKLSKWCGMAISSIKIPPWIGMSTLIPYKASNGSCILGSQLSFLVQDFACSSSSTRPEAPESKRGTYKKAVLGLNFCKS